jgi:Fe-S-cluster containining protein
MAVTKGLMPDRGDGGCINLDDDMSCKIYETRPLLCQVDGMFERMLKHKPNLDQKRWNILNTKECHAMIDKRGLDPKYKIDINDYNK